MIANFRSRSTGTEPAPVMNTDLRVLHSVRLRALVLSWLCALVSSAPSAQTQAPPPASAPVAQTPISPTAAQHPAGASTVPAGVQPPPGYVLGTDDVLTIVFWRDKDMSAEVVVRPDGRITLPLVNDVQAAGLTPEQLRERVTAEAGKYVENPSVTVVVKQINSLRVYITGQVAKPGVYPLTAPTTVLQLISLAGGLHEFAKSKDIVITRTEGGTPQLLRFNYRDVLKGKNLKQNIELKPGDTVLVP
jgi:polysaccharide biosynthesis/export protein